jgi:uncharacterized protein YxeA
MKKGATDMKKIFYLLLLLSLILLTEEALFAWEADGIIPGTDITFSNLALSKNGVSVKLVNSSSDDVRVSLKLSFYNNNGNTIGYSLFGVREIAAGASAEISGNHLSGKWKQCKEAQRTEFLKMTYEPLYY